MDRVIEALKNPKFLGAVITILTMLGINYFKTIDANVLIGAIVTVVTVLSASTAYENGKEKEAAAQVQATQMHVEAAERSAQNAPATYYKG